MTKRSKTPLVLAGCGCGSLIASIVLFAAAFLVGRDGGLGDDAAVYRNTPEGRTGALAEAYVDFEFRYPKTWVIKPDDPDAVNFVSVERAVDDKTWENLNVGYFGTAGSTAANETLYPQLIAQLQNQFAGQFQGLQKVSEGKTKVGEYDAYEGLFRSKSGDVDVYTRVILLPTPDGTKGVTLLMMGTSFCPDLESPEDLGRKGDLPEILESLRLAG